jgi:hypothetical protein
LIKDPIQDERRASILRGVFFSLCIAGYAWVFKKPAASFTEMFLVGAALQLAAFCLRRFVPPDRLPQAMIIFELLVDGATVLVFALGVYGGILNVPRDL